MVARTGCAPEVPQDVFGYDGQTPIADCVEACAREAIGLAIWDGAKHDATRLPPSADPQLTSFFASGTCHAAEAGQAWYNLLSARPRLQYMLGSSPGASEGASAARAYELFPSVPNFVAAMESLLGTPLTPPTTEELHPLYSGSELSWQQVGSSRHPVLLLRRRGGADSDTGAAADAERSAAALHDEEMRIVFNGQRHCYSLRDAKRSEPAWLGSLRHAWRRQPPQARAAAAATARLLQLCGPQPLARHEALQLAMP